MKRFLSILAYGALTVGLCLSAASQNQPLPMPRKPATSAAVDPAKPVSVGPLTARFKSGGLFLDVNRIPLLRGGNVQVFSADYKRGYYGSGENPPVPFVETRPDGGRIYTTQYRYTADGNTFAATQRVEVHAPGLVTFSITARWDGAQPALLEWNPARLWAYALLGTAWEAEPVPAPLPMPVPAPPDAPASVPPVPTTPVPNTENLKPNTNPTSGRIGLRPLAGDYPANRVGPRFRKMTLHTPALGDLILTASDSGEGLVLFDAREDQFLKSEKRFWLGILGLPLTPGQEVTRTITLTIEGNKGRTEGEGSNGANPEHLTPTTQDRIPSPVPISDAQRPAAPLMEESGHSLIVPRPKQMAFADGEFVLPRLLHIYLEFGGHDAGARTQAEVMRMLADLQRQTGTDYAFTNLPNNSDVQIKIAGDGSSEPFARPTAPDNTKRPESYTLQVTSQGVALVGQDAAGTFYGLQTLRQLLTKRPDGVWTLPAVAIEDWPSLPFRGAHIFVGKNALPFHKKLIERIFSRYKMNAMVIECEYVKWKSHPEIAVPFSMEQDDLRADIAFARSRFMEPVPLVNSLGHSEWIFKNEQHRDIAEDVNSPHAYDASNPDTYRFIFDIFLEVCDLFTPRWFHIGHDEVKVPSYDGFGKYPARPANIAKGATQLFIEDTNRLAAWLTERKIRPVMWGDMLLHRSEGDPNVKQEMTAANAPSVEEAQKLRAAMPRHAVVADWRYEPGSEQRNGLAIFRQAGFDTLACAWFQPENIRGWAKQAVQNGSMGTLQTTWAGYDSNERILDSELRQFTAFVLAAEQAWNGGETNVTYDLGEVFARTYRDTPTGSTNTPGWFLDLRGAANVVLHVASEDTLPFAAPAAQNRMPNAENQPLPAAAFPTVADVGLRVTGTDPGGIMLSGVLNSATLPTAAGTTLPATYPQSVLLPVNRKVRSLAFLHATGYGDAPGTVVATYTVVYADGKRVTISLRYGHEIFALDDSAPNAMLSTSALTWGSHKAEDERRKIEEQQSALTLRVLRWTNPRPDVAIANIEFRTVSAYAAPILFGITGVE